jgi:hypothetical protein
VVSETVFAGLLAEVQGLCNQPPPDVRKRAEALRNRAEELLFEGGCPEAIGLLTDALTALILHARACERGDGEHAEDYLEQARLLAKASGQGTLGT